MWYRFLLPQSLILDVFVAAVLLMIPGLTSFFIVQALVDSVLVLGRKPASTFCLLSHLCWRIDAKRMFGRHSHSPGLLLGLSLSDSSTFCILAILLGAAASTYLVTIDIPLPAPGGFRVQQALVPVVAEVSGRVREMYVTEGSAVRAGDILVQLDTTDVLQRKSSLESEIHFAELHRSDRRFDLLKGYDELRQLQMNMDRLTIIAPTDGEIISIEPLRSGETVLAGAAIALIFPRNHAAD